MAPRIRRRSFNFVSRYSMSTQASLMKSINNEHHQLLFSLSSLIWASLQKVSYRESLVFCKTRAKDIMGHTLIPLLHCKKAVSLLSRQTNSFHILSYGINPVLSLLHFADFYQPTSNLWDGPATSRQNYINDWILDVAPKKSLWRLPIPPVILLASKVQNLA